MVLVTDGFWQKTLAVVRALGRAGIAVTVAAETRFAAAPWSRYCARRLTCPTARQDPEGFLDRLRRELASAPYEMLIPMEDDTIALVGEHRARLPADLALPIAPQASLLAALDKGETLALGRRLGLPVPGTWQLRDLGDLDALSRSIPYPAVIKPRRSWGARGISHVRTPEEMRARFRAIHATYPFPLVQEELPLEGTPFAVNLLFDAHSRAVAGLVQKSYREYPVTGGSSTLRESIAHPDMLAQSISLLRALRWVGVAQVEFKLDPRDGVPKLMEINPRFWNSLQLSLDAGVNFPLLLYRVARGEPVAPAFEYPVGVRSRWLLPGDLLHFLANPHRWRLEPSFFALCDPATRYEDWARDDLGGMAGVGLSLLYGLARRDQWQFVFRRQA